MMNPIQFLRATNRTLPVLVLLQYVGRPLTASQVSKYLGVQVRTALGYLHSLAAMDPPLVAEMGNGQFTLIPGELPLLAATPAIGIDPACSSVDNAARNAHENPENAPEDARNAHEDPENARNARANVRETRPNIKNSAQNAPEMPEKSTEIYCAKRAQDAPIKLKKERKKGTESDPLSFFLSSCASDEITGLATDLRAEGLYDDIVLKTLQAYDPPYIREKISYYRHARKSGAARGPGWLSRALKHNFGPPAGYTPPGDNSAARYLTGEYAHLINH